MKPMILRLIRWLARLTRRVSGLYYVNGSETLPPPLSAEDEADAVRRADDPACRALLIEHNLRLVVYIAKRFENTGIGLEDLVSIGTIGLIKAVNTFLPDKNIKLATYASRCIENEILMFIRKTGGLHGEVSIDEPLNVDWDGNELLLSDVLGSEEDSISKNLETDEDRRTVERAIGTLCEREQIIVRLRFGLGCERAYTQKEVADRLGISQSYISRLEKKIFEHLRNEIAAQL